MAPSRRKDVISSRRRRRDDEGEEEGSQAGDVEDVSLSEGSGSSNGDAEGDASEFSDDDSIKIETAPPAPEDKPPQTEALKHPAAQPPTQSHDLAVETTSMLSRSKIDGNEQGTQGMPAGEASKEATGTEEIMTTKVNSNGAPRETYAERNRREHEAYLRERKENPAFVPNRGGFFLHDNRIGSAANGFRPPVRGRGRGRGGFPGTGFGRPVVEPTSSQWAHDLHETVAQPSVPTAPFASRQGNTMGSGGPPPHQTRSFSTTVVLGTVPAVVFITGMEKRVPVKNISKKQYTLLPNHRPPLRRDKPVRVSIPNASPRYIFPAVERSFIFIPRALRPNQQGYMRGRGRGSYAGSRRTSIYGSTYTPSVAMSRRSSVGRGFVPDELRSPGGSVLPRTAASIPDIAKPVVRLPPPLTNAGIPMNPGVVPLPVVMMPPQSFNPAHTQLRANNQPIAIPMHQPSPRKTVSVADIEAPGRFSFNPPAQQMEQPFHQQVPPQVGSGPVYGEDPASFHPHSRHPSHPSQPSATPLSQIPEGAIHAQPFQPYPMGPGFASAPYQSGPMYYPPPGGDFPGFSPANAPPFVPQSNVPFMVPAAPPTAPPNDNNSGQGQMVAHESNGMVYYYDASQVQSAPNYGYPAAPPGGVVGMGGMMTPPGGYYFSAPPTGVFYPPQ